MPSRRAFLAAVALLAAATAAAQQLEPRSYSASPVGTNFVVLGFTNSYGALTFDPAVPITDASASVKGLALGYGRTFAVGKMQGLVTAIVPYAWGSISGDVGASVNDSTIHRAGFADMQVKGSLIIIGSPALKPAEFFKTPAHKFIFGASLTVVAPTGQYVPEHLINVGTNRWAFKPEVGASYSPNKKLYVDLYAAVWLFADNSAFYPGTSVKSQDPMPAIQLHVSYTFAWWIWAALDGTYYFGGGTQLDGGPTTSRMDNSRLGATVSISTTRTQAIKLTYSAGATARVGSRFRTIGVAYQVVWF